MLRIALLGLFLSGGLMATPDFGQAQAAISLLSPRKIN